MNLCTFSMSQRAASVTTAAQGGKGTLPTLECVGSTGKDSPTIDGVGTGALAGVDFAITWAVDFSPTFVEPVRGLELGLKGTSPMSPGMVADIVHIGGGLVGKERAHGPA